METKSNIYQKSTKINGVKNITSSKTTSNSNAHTLNKQKSQCKNTMKGKSVCPYCSSKNTIIKEFF